MPKKELIDTTNLEKSLNKLKFKYGKLGEFKILLIGILIGAIMSALIQLFILPFSYDGSMIKYGNTILFENVGPGSYAIITFAAVCIGIVIILLGFKALVFGIFPEERVQLRYKNNYKKVYQDLTKFLRAECNNIDAKVRVDDGRIFCYRKEWGDKDHFFTVVFRSDLGILNITFNREDTDSMTLVNKVKEKYK
jgi:hypothetical protein